MRDVLKIETERLRLRPLRMADAPRVARFMADPGVTRMLSLAPNPYPPIAAEGWIMTLNARAPLEQDFVFAMDKPGEGLIGVVGAHKRGGEDVEIGYWLGRPFWGAGLASEALKGFVSQAGRLGGLWARHFADNPASGRVLEKAGFAYTGEVGEVYSLGRGARVASRRMRYVAGEAPARRREGAWVH